jgi:hypothetical protein
MTEFRCPVCARAILNRRLPSCEFCDAPLPEELLLSEVQQCAADLEVRVRDRAKIRATREREARRRAEARERGFWNPGLFP